MTTTQNTGELTVFHKPAKKIKVMQSNRTQLKYKCPWHTLHIQCIAYLVLILRHRLYLYYNLEFCSHFCRLLLETTDRLIPTRLAPAKQRTRLFSLHHYHDHFTLLKLCKTDNSQNANHLVKPCAGVELAKNAGRFVL